MFFERNDMEATMESLLGRLPQLVLSSATS